MLYKVFQLLSLFIEILKCDHNSNESYWAVLSCGTVYYAVQGVSTFESVDEILKCDHSNETATERYFLMEVPQKGLSLKAKKA